MPAWISPNDTADTRSTLWATERSQARTAPCGGARLSSETTFVSSKYTPYSIETGCRSTAMLAARRNLQFTPPLVGQQKFLERADRRTMEAAPFLDRHQHGCITAALGHELRPLLQTGIKHFAEPCLGVLHRPCLHGTSPD